MMEGKGLAHEKVTEFHKLMNEADEEKILALIHPQFFEETSKEEAKEFFAAIRTKLGKVESSKTRGWHVNTSNGVLTVDLVQDTSFENGRGGEAFVFRISGAEARLLSYNINSRDLIVN